MTVLLTPLLITKIHAHVVELDLSNNSLTTLPTEIGTMKVLEKLKLMSNAIVYLPQSIGQISTLNYLDLSKNQIVTNGLPITITKLPELKYLNLSNNKLTNIPRFGLAQMPKLKKLNLKGNQLTEMSLWCASFEEEIEHRDGVEVLNYLKALNKGVDEVYRMKLMFVGNGNVGKTSLLKNIISQYSPQSKYVSLPSEPTTSGGNLFSDLSTTPPAGVKDSPLLVPLETIQNNIMFHLTKTIEYIENPQILNPTAVCPIDTDSNVATDGIDIRRVHIPITEDNVNNSGGNSSNNSNSGHHGHHHSNSVSQNASDKTPSSDKYLDFACWDFAGQEVYYATHSFFLSVRSIYLVIFNLCETPETNRIEYWLQSIYAKTSGESPVILIGTHADDKRLPKESITEYFELLMKKYGNRFLQAKLSKFDKKKRSMILGHIYISNTGEGKRSFIQHLVNDHIVKIAKSLPFMPEKIPLTYLAFEEKLALEKQMICPPIINLKRAAYLAELCGIPASDVSATIRFLSHVGSIVYFGDNDPGLKDIIILDPQWITKIFATVVSLKLNFVKGGVLNTRDLYQLWKPPEYPIALHPTFVLLLEKFQIISAISRKRIREQGAEYFSFIVPSMLPDNPPISEQELNKIWQGAKLEDSSNRAFAELENRVVGRFWQFEFVPLGFFSRLIVSLLTPTDSITDKVNEGWETEPLYYWKTGIVLKKTCYNRSLSASPVPLYRVIIYIRLRSLTEKERTDKEKGDDRRLEVWIKGPKTGTHMTEFINQIDPLITDWFNLGFKVFIPCYNCINYDLNYTNYTVFSLMDCENEINKGKSHVMCRTIDQVLLQNLLPEMVWSDNYGIEKLDFNDFKTVGSLGKGAFGSVFKAQSLKTGKMVAVKQLASSGQEIYDPNQKGGGRYEEFRRELYVMSQINNHPNIVTLLGLVVDPLLLVLECCELGSLHEFKFKLKRDKVFNMSFILTLATNIANAMNFLHSHTPKIIHRDLKSPNVLLDIDPNSECGITGKVSDFGTSRAMTFSEEMSDIPIDNPVWMAPELITKKPYNEKVDVYSYGVILWELVTNEEFMDGHTALEIEARIIKGERMEIPKWFASVPRLEKLIKVCWAQEAKDRCSFDQALLILKQIRIDSSQIIDQEEKLNWQAYKPPEDDLITNFIDDADFSDDDTTTSGSNTERSIDDNGSLQDQMIRAGLMESPSPHNSNNGNINNSSSLNNRSLSKKSTHRPQLSMEHDAIASSTRALSQKSSSESNVMCLVQSPDITGTQTTSKLSYSSSTTSNSSHTSSNLRNSKISAQMKASGNNDVNLQGLKLTPEKKSNWQAAAVPKRNVRLFEHGGMFLQKIEKTKTEFTAFASSGGDNVYCGGKDGHLHIYNKHSAQILKTLELPSRNLAAVRSVLYIQQTKDIWILSENDGITILPDTANNNSSSLTNNNHSFTSSVNSNNNNGNNSNSLNERSRTEVFTGSSSSSIHALGPTHIEQESKIYAFGEVSVLESEKKTTTTIWMIKTAKPKRRGDTLHPSSLHSLTPEHYEKLELLIYSAESKKLKKQIKLTETGTSGMILNHLNYVWITIGSNIICFDPKTWLKEGALEGHTGVVKSVIAVGADEIWSGGEDNIIRVWRPKEGGKAYHKMEGHSGGITGMCTDGECVWSWGGEDKIYLWDVKTHCFIKRLNLETSAVKVDAGTLVKRGGRVAKPGGTEKDAVWISAGGAVCVYT
eukprot:TRINITY_DN530_c1_g1_i2.p1 TRINITY_DN530_c1_g1~~TRINITY_DN530_c1_g1_i2.p1  ORF type:complete len:1951 (-),score=435.72 TRINITY_DN530_c1_g1_i2:123-5267(-)